MHISIVRAVGLINCKRPPENWCRAAKILKGFVAPLRGAGLSVIAYPGLRSLTRTRSPPRARRPARGGPVLGYYRLPLRGQGAAKAAQRTRTVRLAAFLILHNLLERVRLEAGAANKRAVDLFL